MTTHARNGEKKRTLNRKEMQEIERLLQLASQDWQNGVAQTLLSDFRSAKRVVIVTPKR